jgi:N-methylhydantoinase A
MRVGVDVGGTFTDLVALGADGTVRLAKVSSTPHDPSEAVWHALEALGRGPVAALLHGTTVATNALLERRGARVALVTTAGFEDLLWLARQDRAGLYDLARHHPPPVVERADVVGVAERIGAEGVIAPLDDGELARVVAEVRDRRPAAVAVCLLFSFRDPSHERRVAGALRTALPGLPVVASAELLPVFREYERFSTTAAEAYLRPLVGTYVERLETEAARRGVGELRVMASNGGTLTPAQAAQRATALALSGPAGGVEGARLLGEAVGERNLLTLDMGGTSADASVVVDGRPLSQTSGAVGGIPIALPHVLIETVGAGGGSVAWLDAGGALRVGPRSAGAVPGPACYGRGGTEPTVTDAALVLGWLDPAQPLASDLRLDAGAAHVAVGALAQAAGLDRRRCAEGIVEIVVANMVRALRRVSVERGLDPRAMTLVPFGGAGPLFTCRMAEALGMTRALVPPHPGVLSAFGLAAAPGRVERIASVHRLLHELTDDAWDALFAPVAAAVERELAGAVLTRVADCRYPGQGYEVAVEVDGGPAVVAEMFHEAHRARFGHADPLRPVEVVNVRVVGSSERVIEGSRGGRTGGPVDRWTRGLTLRGDSRLETGTAFAGPVTIPLEDATVRIEAGWTGRVHETGAIVVQKTTGATGEREGGRT